MEEYYVVIYTLQYHNDRKITFSNGKISKDRKIQDLCNLDSRKRRLSE